MVERRWSLVADARAQLGSSWTCAVLYRRLAALEYRTFYYQSWLDKYAGKWLVGSFEKGAENEDFLVQVRLFGILGFVDSV